MHLTSVQQDGSRFFILFLSHLEFHTLVHNIYSSAVAKIACMLMLTGGT